MTILEVTHDEVLEHEIMPGEELHHRLNTIEAWRFIGGLANGERKRFEGLVDKNGDPDPRQQESYMIQKWTEARDNDAIAGHNATRALQSVRHFYASHLGKALLAPADRRFYYPLLDTPKAPFIAELHWDQEARFRRGISKVFAEVSGKPEDTVLLPKFERGTIVPEADRTAFFLGERVAMENTVSVLGEDQILGSNYVFTVRTEQGQAVLDRLMAPLNRWFSSADQA